MISIVSGAIAALLSLITIITIIVKFGKSSGVNEEKLNAIIENTENINLKVDKLADITNSILVRNAAKDVEMETSKECINEVKKKIENHSDQIGELKGRVNLIEDKLIIKPKQNKKEI